MDALISAAIQGNRAREDARRQAEFAKLPPDEQAAIKLEELMKRWPMNSWWHFFWTGDQLAKKLTKWLEELKSFVLDLEVDIETVFLSDKLGGILLRHDVVLTQSISLLVCRSYISAADCQRLTAFGNRVAVLVDCEKCDW